MRTYWHSTPGFIKWMYPNWIWDLDSSNNDIYLTFDDGPHPEATPFILGELSKYTAKATFFCVGENIKKYPKIVESILADGHAIGNHTNNHLKGRSSVFEDYIKNVDHCDTLSRPYLFGNQDKLFRPPYGSLTAKQSKYLRANYNIVMWDYLVGDFDKSLSSQKCIDRAIANIRQGSIVVFHDNRKAFETLREILPAYLEALHRKGFQSKTIAVEA